MSGQPYIYPTDVNKYRQQYLANLNLRAIIDDKNLQANKVYKQTGAPTQPTDFRTTSEKYADVERAKVEARKRLLELTSGDEVDIILSRLDPALLEFLLNRINFIINDLKPKYARGIPALIFLTYLQKLERKARETQDVEYGLQETTGRDILASSNAILANIPTQANIETLKDEIVKALDSIPNAETIRGQIQDGLDAYEFTLQSIEAGVRGLEALSADGELGPESAALGTTLSSVNDEILSSAETENLITSFQRAERTGNIELKRNLLQRVLERFAAQDEQAEQSAQILAQLQRLGPSLQQTSNKPIYKSPNSTALKTGDAITQYIGQLKLFFKEREDDPFATAPPPKLKTKDDKLAFLRANDVVISNVLTAPATPTGPAVAPPLTGKASVQKNLSGKLEEVKGEMGDEEVAGFRHLQKNRRIAIGKGIYQPAKRYDIIKKEQIDYTKGIEPIKKWVKFGKNVINISKLSDDIINVKREKGSGISGIKSVRVSKKLGNVFRKIVGNGFPSFEELQNLDSEEKDYLYKVVKASDLLEKLNIPTPSKDEEEKDIHQFELMKGQILAGNNNNELIKKFKTLLIKLMQRGSIPKSQAKDILLDLTESGF
jgi:hypothetical protein